MSRNAFDRLAREQNEAEDLREIARMERTSDDAADEAQWTAGQRIAAQRYKHPDCNDPEHPGCFRCQGNEQEEGL